MGAERGVVVLRPRMRWKEAPRRVATRHAGVRAPQERLGSFRHFWLRTRGVIYARAPALSDCFRLVQVVRVARVRAIASWVRRIAVAVGGGCGRGGRTCGSAGVHSGR